MIEFYTLVKSLIEKTPQRTKILSPGWNTILKIWDVFKLINVETTQKIISKLFFNLKLELQMEHWFGAIKAMTATGFKPTSI